MNALMEILLMEMDVTIYVLKKKSSVLALAIRIPLILLLSKLVLIRQQPIVA
jgi:hypothetical protein